jgi:hypothetical protein
MRHKGYALLAAGLILAAAAAAGQPRAKDGEWSTNAADLAGTRYIGTLVTNTLVIAGEGQITTTSDHPRGAMLRAYDKATGKEVGAVYLPAPQSGSPMTYMLNGKQYIVVAVSGGAYPGEYLAFRLPDAE